VFSWGVSAIRRRPHGPAGAYLKRAPGTPESR
jgi:hypothetical protein